jgi:hypothetical protein
MGMIAYTKQSGESAVPVTVQIDWLPDGTIKPRYYWMPDGSCLEVLPHCRCMPLALLRDRGEGLRFEVKAEVIETPEHDDDLVGARYETYLYIEDKRFCEKNIIDGRYGHAEKEYVFVTLDVLPNGNHELIYFHVDGKRWKVESPIEVEPRASFRAGGIGIRHLVEARLVNTDDDEDPDPNNPVRRTASVYWELDKWFVARKSA